MHLWERVLQLPFAWLPDAAWPDYAELPATSWVEIVLSPGHYCGPHLLLLFQHLDWACSAERSCWLKQKSLVNISSSGRMYMCWCIWYMLQCCGNAVASLLSTRLIKLEHQMHHFDLLWLWPQAMLSGTYVDQSCQCCVIWIKVCRASF